MSRLRKFFPAAQAAFGILLIVLLWRGLDGAEVGRLLVGVDWRWLAAAFAALTLQTFVSALRWQLTARALGQDFGLMKAVSEYYLAQFFNQTLPGGLLGDAGRAVRARHHAGLVRASQAVAFERLSGQGALFAIMALAFMIAVVIPFGASWPAWLTLAGVAPAAALGAGAALIRAGTRLPGAAGRALSDLRAAFRVSVLDRRAMPLQVGLSLATAGLNVTAFAFAARATGTTLTLAEALALGPAILCFMLIPLTVSGWGLREGAAAALFPLVGTTAEAGLAASVAFGLTLMASALPGLVPLIRAGGIGALTRRTRAEANAAADTAAEIMNSEATENGAADDTPGAKRAEPGRADHPRADSGRTAAARAAAPQKEGERRRVLHRRRARRHAS